MRENTQTYDLIFCASYTKVMTKAKLIFALQWVAFIFLDAFLTLKYQQIISGF